MANNPVMIAEYSSVLDAELARSRLEASGIESWVMKDDAGGMQPQLQITQGVKLFVDEKDIDEALKVLDWEDVFEDDESDEEGDEEV
ncbi:DUF2007 domain-containing protein [bacterium]|nr:DUF2007 domain-containing protein [bacterium]